ncbi:SprT-like family-domain-containing protein [Rhexocercosporidium sp. MPI-PUGE-AT-0058]|nr:SprT-like family-domain-containing protein [Rhexocercosporidium sp. MPI-PUGE-AT-0058]
MARPVEDSDDEFPDLAEIVSRKVISKRTVSSGSSHQGKILETEDGSLDRSSRDNETARGRIERSRSKSNREEGSDIVKPRPKKRVLNQTSDNPLLRPLSNPTLAKDASDRLGKSAPKIEARRQKLVRKPISNADSEDVSKLGSGGESMKENGGSGKQEGLSKRVAAGEEKMKAPLRNSSDLDSDEEEYEGASGLSDFIVDDSTFLDEESMIEAPPPRPARRLVRGRRRPADLEDSDSEDLGRRMGKLKVEDDAFQDPQKTFRNLEDFAENYGDMEPLVRAKRSSEGAQSKPPIKTKTATNGDLLTSDIDDPFTLSYSPSESKPVKVSKEARFVTPPGSPIIQPKRLQSPKKQFPRIPSTPHRPSMDGFWQQDVVNDWNDEYSPQKTLFPKPRENSAAEGSPKKSPVKQDRVAKEAKRAFSLSKHALAECFLTELDSKITSGEIARLSASTGGVKIIWSKKLNTTAGRANWKRETIKSSASAPEGKTIYRHHAAIELAEKVIDDEERLLNVIAHEFCHLANFMISNIKTNPHGKEFKAWAAKCSRHFGDRGIEVTTKHSYAIDYKYVWECTKCGIEFKRHSKSIDPARHQCGSCKSKLVQTKPVPRANAGTVKVSEYQLFVKENMKRLREENPGSPQKDIMGLVGKEYQVYKASKLGGGVKGMESVSIDEVVDSKEGTPDEDVGAVARKLDFLDLTSP